MVRVIIQIALMVISTILQLILAPKPVIPKLSPKEMGEVPIAERGAPIPVVFGTRYVRQPNVVWYGDVQSIPITKDVPEKS